MKPGPRNLLTDVAGLRVGCAQGPGLRSGATVVVGEAPFAAAVHIMGGAPGTRETELLDPDRLVPGVDALVLSGGSVFGLDAASGVVDALRERGRGFAVGEARAPIAPAAILFDLLNGGAKDWSRNPYAALGRQALAAAEEDFPLGSTGAGSGAIAGSLKGGLGSASLVLPDSAGGFTVAALAAVNAVGEVVAGDGPNFWAGPFEIGDEFGALGPPPAALPPEAAFRGKLDALAPGAATTLAVVATDAALDKAQARRLAVAAHDGLARAIVPAHTPFDGDLVFAAATGARAGAVSAQILHALCAAAAHCLARAIARGVFEATAAPGDLVPCWRERFRKAA